MRQLSVFLWVLFGLIGGYQLRGPQIVTVEVIKELPPQIQVETVYREVPALCDYGPYEQTIASLQEELDKTTPTFRDVVVPVYVPAKVIVPKSKEGQFTVLLSLGEGIKSVDIKPTPDGNSVYGDPKKGMVGGVSAYYKFKPFEVFSVPVNGLTVGGGLIGAETKFLSIGYSF